MERLEVLITTTNVTVTVQVYYGNRSVPTTADTIDENDRDF
jgi:hypothetical protein